MTYPDYSATPTRPQPDPSQRPNRTPQSTPPRPSYLRYSTSPERQNLRLGTRKNSRPNHTESAPDQLQPSDLFPLLIHPLSTQHPSYSNLPSTNPSALEPSKKIADMFLSQSDMFFLCPSLFQNKPTCFSEPTSFQKLPDLFSFHKSL